MKNGRIFAHTSVKILKLCFYLVAFVLKGRIRWNFYFKNILINIDKQKKINHINSLFGRMTKKYNMI